MITFYSVYNKNLKFFSCPFYGVHDFSVIEGVLKTIKPEERSDYSIFKVGQFDPKTNAFESDSVEVCDLADYAMDLKTESESDNNSEG